MSVSDWQLWQTLSCYGTSCCVTRRIRGGNWHHISLYICDKQDILPYPPLCCIWILNRLHFGSLFAWHGLTMFDFWSTKTDSFWVRCLEVASMREELKCFRESHIQGAMFCHLTLWDGFNLVFETITGLLGYQLTITNSFFSFGNHQPTRLAQRRFTWLCLIMFYVLFEEIWRNQIYRHLQKSCFAIVSLDSVDEETVPIFDDSHAGQARESTLPAA